MNKKDPKPCPKIGLILIAFIPLPQIKNLGE